MSDKKAGNTSTPIKNAGNPAIVVKPISNWLIRIAWVAALLTGVVMSLKSLTEPDTWWQLRTGEWIWQNGKVPAYDIFSYTMHGTPWINVKWLSEVILYFFQLIGGPEFVLILQVIVTILILIIIRKIYNILYEIIYLKKPAAVTPSLIFAILLTIICIGFRLNGRPEMFSHLFTVSYILILLKNRFKKSNLLFAIIPLQVLWTNLHEGYGAGIAILFIFSAASFAEFVFFKFFLKKDFSFDWRLFLVLSCSIMAMAIHPFGFRMITHPVEIYRQLNVNKYTTELVSFSDTRYWTFQAYLSIILFAVALIFLFLNYNQNKESRFLQLTKNFGWGYTVLLFAFFILSLTANRNIPFSVISITPVLATGFGHFVSVYIKRKKLNAGKETMFVRRLYISTIIFSVLLYLSIVSNKYYSWTHSHSTYGLQVDALYNPSGAAGFIKENNITGRCFSDYLTSSYLLWALRPGFKTFIDLRDLDVFPVSFFEQFAGIVNDSTQFEKADSQYHFDYIILYRSQFLPLHNYLLRSNNYELVFVDPVASVYLKREERFKFVIEKFGFNNGANDIFSVARPTNPRVLSTAISTIFNPFFTPRDYDDVDFNLEAAKFYFNCDYTNLAYSRIQQSLQKDPDNSAVQDMLGNIALSGLQRAKNEQAQQYLATAEDAFHKANNLNSKDEQALKGLGECALATGNTEEAISYFQKCLDVNPNNVDCWANLADVYEDLSNNDLSTSKQWLDKRLDCMKKLNDLNPDNPLILVELGYAYYKTGDCNSAMNYINRIKTFNKFPPGQKADLVEVLSHCVGEKIK
jgi:tetratricopeptide (TPR) repeat protein